MPNPPTDARPFPYTIEDFREAYRALGAVPKAAIWFLPDSVEEDTPGLKHPACGCPLGVLAAHKVGAGTLHAAIEASRPNLFGKLSSDPSRYEEVGKLLGLTRSQVSWFTFAYDIATDDEADCPSRSGEALSAFNTGRAVRAAIPPLES